MNERMILKNRINALDFAIHEMVLFLDTHPRDQKAIQMLREYRRRRREAIANYEAKCGPYIKTIDDVHPKDYWNWIDSPWPWEREV